MTEPSAEPTAPTPSEANTGALTTQPAVGCVTCHEPALRVCHHCGADSCAAHSYSEDGDVYYCRNCADSRVGVCDVCDALHARPCWRCDMKVCERHWVRVIHRWGWGGAPGQGGFLSWFPVMRTYCEEHGQGQTDAAKPQERTLKGYDGSSPEW